MKPDPTRSITPNEAIRMLDGEFSYVEELEPRLTVRHIADSAAYAAKRSLKRQRTPQQRRNRRIEAALCLFDAGLVLVIVALVWGWR